MVAPGSTSLVVCCHSPLWRAAHVFFAKELFTHKPRAADPKTQRRSATTPRVPIGDRRSAIGKCRGLLVDCRVVSQSCRVVSSSVRHDRTTHTPVTFAPRARRLRATAVLRTTPLATTTKITRETMTTIRQPIAAVLPTRPTGVQHSAADGRTWSSKRVTCAVDYLGEKFEQRNDGAVKCG